jgi:hypothetical protein
MASHSDTPELRAARKAAFLGELARVGEIGPACAAADICRKTYDRWRAEDEDFAEAVVRAKADATDMAVMELRRRGVEGWDENSFHEGGIVYKTDPLTGALLFTDELEPIPVMVRKRSDRLLETYVRANRREYRDKGSLALTGGDGGPIKSSVTVTFVDADEDWLQ